jgi:hypothetical protein
MSLKGQFILNICQENTTSQPQPPSEYKCFEFKGTVYRKYLPGKNNNPAPASSG